VLDLAKLEAASRRNRSHRRNSVWNGTEVRLRREHTLRQALITLNIPRTSRRARRFPRYTNCRMSRFLKRSASPCDVLCLLHPRPPFAGKWCRSPMTKTRALSPSPSRPRPDPETRKLCRLYIFPIPSPSRSAPSGRTRRGARNLLRQEAADTRRTRQETQAGRPPGKRKLGTIQKPGSASRIRCQARTDSRLSRGRPTDRKLPADVQTPFKSAFPSAPAPSRRRSSPHRRPSAAEASARTGPSPSDASAGVAYKEMSRSLLNAAAFARQHPPEARRLLDAQIRRSLQSTPRQPTQLYPRADRRRVMAACSPSCQQKRTSSPSSSPRINSRNLLTDASARRLAREIEPRILASSRHSRT